ncbi:ABC transporter substrate-binding protein [Reinekea sp. G2M2-21]|uniref:ABC transporter substrate-binding protein n=1 Tax=Reinekea sp. G2M2-21 TaxID=2788942 RepID=UPI0018AAF7E6|nr:ABC transporter substrate-binding protein [Reinekea sp. G2M2-21]
MPKLVNKLLLMLLATPVAFAGNVEVLHYWTSGGEAAALDVLKKQMADEGHQWQDFVIAGGGGGNAMAELQTRVLKGLPPAAAQIKGLDIQRWARLGFLANLNNIAQADKWDDKLPSVVSDVMKHNDQYVAVPVNVHRTNWLWINKPLLDALNLKAPKTWDEFDAAAKVIQDAGYQVIAQGDQAWQHATLFEAVALSVGGADYYKRAFVEHEFSAIKSAETDAVFERYYKLVKLMKFDSDAEWHQATNKVIEGKAAFQFMGDWAKGEFIKAEKKPNKDFMCVPAPGTANKFLFNIDSFAIFNLRNVEASEIQAQTALVRNIMSDSFQSAFNQNKGSIPARTDMSMATFDLCAQYSMSEFLNANDNGALLPSIAHGMATTGTVQQYFYEKIAELTKTPDTPAESSKQLAKAIRYGQYILK